MGDQFIINGIHHFFATHSIEAVAGTSVRIVLKGEGTGRWYVLTGFPKP